MSQVKKQKTVAEVDTDKSADKKSANTGAKMPPRECDGVGTACGGFRSGILSKDEIVGFGLIDGFDSFNSNVKKDCVQISSYDLRLGDIHYVSDSEGKWIAIYVGTDGSFYNKMKLEPFYVGKELQISTDLAIPPFGRAVIKLHEVRKCT